MKDLKQTRQHLTRLFVVIVALLFLLFGCTFFSYKFFSNKSEIKNNSKNITKIMSAQSSEIQEYILNKDPESTTSNDKEIAQSIIAYAIDLHSKEGISMSDYTTKTSAQESIVEGVSDFEFFNEKVAFFDTKNELIYSNIENNEQIDFKEYEYLETGGNFESDLYILKTNLNSQYSSLVFIKRTYTMENLKDDLLYLFLVLLLFSALLFVIGNLFISRLLRPVEENMTEMDNFIDNAGHELKTPIAAIVSSVGLMKELGTYDGEIVGDILRESGKTADILSTLRTMSKVTKNLPIENIDIKEFLTETIRGLDFLIKSHQVKIELETKNNFFLDTNKNMLYLVVVNLLKNAIKYNKKDGKINIILDERYIEINDTGVGIPQEEISKVFDRFYRVKNHRDAKGYGLGLSLVKKICDQYNWNIQIDSIENLGTKIKIEF